MSPSPDLQERYGLEPGDDVIGFGAAPPPPPGYVVVWLASDEHYHWAREGGEFSCAVSDRWDAWHGAWRHHRALHPL